MIGDRSEREALTELILECVRSQDDPSEMADEILAAGWVRPGVAT